MFGTSFCLALPVLPLSFSSAFTTAPTPSGVGRTTWTSLRSEAASHRVPVSLTRSCGKGGEEEGGPPVGRSRLDFLREVGTGVSVYTLGVGLAELGLGASPAVADSTGKYSTKATARKRYLPRISKLVKAFADLRKDLEAGSATPSSAFFTELLPDSLSALDLFGSSLKRGEYPDSKSRGMQKLAADFGVACESISKSLGKKGGDPIKAYDAAAVILAEYLKGAELDPIGSDSYKD